MPKPILHRLGVMVRERRDKRKLREVAQEIGIGAATLMRVENGRIPDVTTFGLICKWLKVDPGTFLGFEGINTTGRSSEIQISAHLRVDQTPKPETVNALAKMILLAARKQLDVEQIED